MTIRDLITRTLGTRMGRDLVASLGVFEIVQNMEVLEVLGRQTYEIEKMLRKKYGKLKPVRLLMSVPGIGFLTAFDFICSDL